MALPSTGPISMRDINIELNKREIALISLGDADVRELAGVPDGMIAMGELRGKENWKGDIYIVDTPQKATKIWDDLFELYGYDLRNVMVKVDDSITDLNGGGTKGQLIMYSPYKIVGKNLKNIAFLFVTFTSLITVSEVLLDSCPNLENVQSCFDGCTNADFIPELWNKDKFPKITNYSLYANNCTKAINYRNIPVDWK